MNYTNDDIDNLLEKWHEAKREISLLEKKCEKYKKYSELIMSQKNTDSLSNNTYSLTKREMNRTILAKDDVPTEVWNKYSKSISYPMFIIKKRKEK